MERELTLASVAHPDFIDSEWIRVDHPTLNPLTNGAPDLGWEGDPRLVVYLHMPTKTFALWRLEHDNEYRPIGHLDSGAEITPATVNKWCSNLVRIDQRRGFDPFIDVVSRQDKADIAKIHDQRAATAQVADKLLFGLARSHLPGAWIPKRVFPLSKG